MYLIEFQTGAVSYLADVSRNCHSRFLGSHQRTLVAARIPRAGVAVSYMLPLQEHHKESNGRRQVRVEIARLLDSWFNVSITTLSYLWGSNCREHRYLAGR
jgi:hypothetical protein